MWLANAVINWEDRLFRWFPTPNPMTKIRFDNGITVTIRDVAASEGHGNGGVGCALFQLDEKTGEICLRPEPNVV